MAAVEMDEAVFAAFYHDKDGLTGHAEMVENSLRLLGQSNPLRREFVEGSLEVHRVPGYGAIQINRHEFCHWENGVQDCGVRLHAPLAPRG